MLEVLEFFRQITYFSLAWAPGVILFENLLPDIIPSRLNRLVFGSAMWMLVLTIPSLFFGHLLNIKGATTTYFSLVAFAGLIIYGISAIRFILKVLFSKANRLDFKNKSFYHSYLSATIFLTIVVTFIVIATHFTHILWQWDAISLYLPAAKSVAETGFFGESILFGSNIENLQPPLMILLYSWSFYFDTTFFLRAIPLLFLFLAAVSIYRIATSFWSKGVAVTAVLCFISFLGVHYYMSKSSLYLDMGLTFTLSASLLSLTQTIKSSEAKTRLLTTAPLVLLPLAKETGVFYMLFFLVFLFFKWNRSRSSTIIRSLIIVSPFIFLTLTDSMSPLFPGYEQATELTIARVALIFIFFLLLTRLPIELNYNKKFITRTLQLILIVSACSIFYIPNFYRFGILTANFAPSMAKEMAVYDVSFATLNSVQPLNVLQFYRFFLSNLFISTNLIPLLVGLFAVVYTMHRRNLEKTNELAGYGLLLSLLLFCLLHWSFLSYSRMEGDFYRNLLPLATVSCLMVASGVSAIGKWLRISTTLHPILYAATTSFGVLYIWFSGSSPFDWIHNLAFLATNRFEASLIDIGILSIPWLWVISMEPIMRTLIPILNKMKSGSKRNFKKYILLFMSVLAMGLPLQLLFSSVPVTLSKSPNPWLYNDAEYIETLYGNHYLNDVIQYFVNNPILSKNWTISFAAWPVAFFSNAQFTDIARSPSLVEILPLIVDMNVEAAADKLLEQGYLHILVPKREHPHFSRYEQVQRISPIMSSLPDNRYLYVGSGRVLLSVKTFEMYVLYSFIQTEDNRLSLPVADPGSSVSIGNWTHTSNNLIVMERGSRIDFSNNWVKDGAIEAQIMHADQGTISNIFFRVQSQDLERENLYWVRLDSREYYSGFHLYKKINGQEELLASYNCPINDNVWYYILLEFNGDSIRGYFNGEEKWHVFDEAFSSGYWGFDVEPPSSGSAYFQSISLSIHFEDN